MKELNGLNKRILIIPDIHFPFHHPYLFPFLSDIKKKYRPQIVICLGDELDLASFSFHDHLPEMPGPSDELNKGRELIKELNKIFPKMSVLESNHGSLVYRRAKKNGIPRDLIKSYSDYLEIKGWDWYDEIILKTKLGPIYMCHGRSGVYGRLARLLGCSTIQGHYHSIFEITWHKSAMREIFSMFCGCLIDIKSMAFEYGKNSLPKPILGCGFIDEKGIPSLIKMPLDARGKYVGL